MPPSLDKYIAEEKGKDAAPGLHEWLDSNVLRPAYVAGVVQPANLCATIANGLAGSEVVPKLPALEITATESQSDELVRGISSGLAGLWPYLVGGKLTSLALRAGGRQMLAEGLAARILASETTGMVLAAGAIDGLRDVNSGETRLGNVAGGVAAFGVFGAGNQMARKWSISERALLANPLVGALGGEVHLHVSKYVSGGAVEPGERWRAWSQGAATNFVLPWAQEGLSRGIDKLATKMNRGVSVDRYARYNNLEGQSPSLDAELARNPLARVKSGIDGDGSRVDLQTRVVTLDGKAASKSADLGHELAHVRLSRLAEPQFKEAADLLKSGDQVAAEQKFKDTRRWQERQAQIVGEQIKLELARTEGREPVPAVGGEPVRAVGTEPVRAVGAEPVRAVGGEPVRAVGGEPVRAVGAEPVRAVGTEPVRAVGAEPVQAVVRDPARATDGLGLKGFKVGAEYEGRFDAEWNQFQHSGGKFRPTVEFKTPTDTALIVIDSGFDMDSMRRAGNIIGLYDATNGKALAGEPVVSETALKDFSGDWLKHGSVVLAGNETFSGLTQLVPDSQFILVRAVGNENAILRTKWENGKIVTPGWTEGYRWGVDLGKSRGLSSVANCSFGGFTHAMDGGGWESFQLGHETGAGKPGHIVVAASGPGDGRALRASWQQAPGEVTVVNAVQTDTSRYNFWAGKTAASAGEGPASSGEAVPSYGAWRLNVHRDGQLVHQFDAKNVSPSVWNGRQQLTFSVAESGLVQLQLLRGGDASRPSRTPQQFDCWVASGPSAFENFKNPMVIPEPAVFPHVLAVGLRNCSYGIGQAQLGIKPDVLLPGTGPISFRTPEVTAMVARLFNNGRRNFDVDGVRSVLGKNGI